MATSSCHPDTYHRRSSMLSSLHRIIEPPPWEVVVLVAQTLDPKTLATASCVCKTWLQIFSSDRQWEQICQQEFPNVSNLKSTHPSVPYRTLYSLGFSAAKLLRQSPPKPSISLPDLIFAIDIFNIESSLTSRSNLELKVGHLWITGDELERLKQSKESNDLFQFDVVLKDVLNNADVEVKEGIERVKVVWNVVLSGWRGVFCLMECEGKVGVGGEVWFSKEVVSGGGCGCCCREIGVGSGLMADLRLGFCRDEEMKKMKVVKVSMGLLSSCIWRYVCIDDGLRYLQHFL